MRGTMCHVPHAHTQVNLLYVAATRAIEECTVAHQTAEWLELAGVVVAGGETAGTDDGEDAASTDGASASSDPPASSGPPPPLATGEAAPTSGVAVGTVETAGQEADVTDETDETAGQEADVEFVGERSVEERNAEGFAHAIDLDRSPAAPTVPSGLIDLSEPDSSPVGAAVEMSSCDLRSGVTGSPTAVVTAAGAAAAAAGAAISAADAMEAEALVLHRNPVKTDDEGQRRQLDDGKPTLIESPAQNLEPVQDGHATKRPRRTAKR